MRPFARLFFAIVTTLVLAGCFVEHCEWTPDTAVEADAATLGD
jgi:hypothetical protein